HLASLRAEHRRRRDAFVRAFQQQLAPGSVRFSSPDGGLYLWCRLSGGVQARTVRHHALRESIVFVPGEAFYVDRGGTQDVRVCYSAQPPDKAPHVARCLARAIAAAKQQGATAESPLVRIV